MSDNTTTVEETVPDDLSGITVADDGLVEAVKDAIKGMGPEAAAAAIQNAVWHAVCELVDEGAIATTPSGDAARDAINVEALADAFR